MKINIHEYIPQYLCFVLLLDFHYQHFEYIKEMNMNHAGKNGHWLYHINIWSSSITHIFWSFACWISTKLLLRAQGFRCGPKAVELPWDSLIHSQILRHFFNAVDDWALFWGNLTPFFENHHFWKSPLKITIFENHHDFAIFENHHFSWVIQRTKWAKASSSLFVCWPGL